MPRSASASNSKVRPEALTSTGCLKMRVMGQVNRSFSAASSSCPAARPYEVLRVHTTLELSESLYDFLCLVVSCGAPHPLVIK